MRQVGGSLVSLEHQVISIHASATSIALKVIRLDLAVGIVPYQTTLHSERILLMTSVFTLYLMIFSPT